MDSIKATPTWTRRKAITIAAITGFICLGIGGSSAQGAPQVETKTVTNTVTKEVTPESCNSVIDLDNQVFTKQAAVYDALSRSLDGTQELEQFTAALSDQTAFVKAHTAERQQWMADCVGKL